MKPRIGDIWLDTANEHSVVLGFEPYYADEPDRIRVNLLVLDSEYAKSGLDDFTHVEITAFGPKQYMYKLVSRIDNAEETED